MSLTLFLENLDTKQKLAVDYGFGNKTHNVWEDDTYLGRLRLRELFFNGFKCVKIIVGENNDKLG